MSRNTKGSAPALLQGNRNSSSNVTTKGNTNSNNKNNPAGKTTANDAKALSDAAPNKLGKITCMHCDTPLTPKAASTHDCGDCSSDM